MSDTSDAALVESAPGLTYRLRNAEGGGSTAPGLILLHGVGSDESGFIEIARQLDWRLVIVLIRGQLVLAPMQFGWFQVRFTETRPTPNTQHADYRTRMRAQAILRLSQGLTLQQTADEFMVHIDGIEQWRQRWNRLGLFCVTASVPAQNKL